MKSALLLLIIFVSFGTIASSQESVTKQNLKTHLYTLASDSLLGRAAGSENGRKAAAYILSQFEEIGLAPGIQIGEEESYLQKFGRSNGQCFNVVGKIPGNDPALSKECIVVGAHYDHLGYKIRGGDTLIFHGADDNASGVAALIETARNLKKVEKELKRTVFFVAFDAEELGLIGSQAMAKSSMSDHVKLMINMDMIGWLREAKRLRLIGVATLRDGRDIISTMPVPEGLELKLINYNNDIFTASDHISFFNQGIPAMMFTTGSKSPYHEPEDTAEKIDYEGLEVITDYVTGVTTEFATKEELLSPSKRWNPDRERMFQVAVSGSIGSSRQSYYRGAYAGSSDFSWNAGAFLQYNMSREFAIRIEALYNHRTARYPQVNAAGEWIISDRDRKFVSPALTVPVTGVSKLHFGHGISCNIGLGGYYSYVFDATINGAKTDFYRHEGGISFNVGFEIKRVGIAMTALFGLSPISPTEGRITNNSVYWTMYYKL